MDRATRYGSYVPVTTIGIAPIFGPETAGDESAGSPASAAGNVIGARRADLGRHSPHDLVRERQDALSPLSPQGGLAPSGTALRFRCQGRETWWGSRGGSRTGLAEIACHRMPSAGQSEPLQCIDHKQVTHRVGWVKRSSGDT
jgi:hypothetical protein